MIENMKAIAYTKNAPVSEPTSQEDVTLPLPQIGARDLLVEVKAVSVNPADAKIRANVDPEGASKVLGYDAAGIVHAVGGEVTLFNVGDKVYYAGDVTRQGTNSEFHAVDERIVGTMPTSLDFAQAAALPLTSITAWEGLFDRFGLHAESTGTLLMIGGAGGVGSMVIQLAKALAPGVRVIASATRPESREWVLGLGADDTVRHGEHLREDVLKVAPEGVNYIFSTNSEGQLTAYVEILQPFGKIVAIDDPTEMDVLALKTKSLSWHWEFMFTRSMFQTPDMIEQHHLLDRVAALVDAGTVRTTLTTTLAPISAENLRAAHALVESGRTLGKVVVAAEPSVAS